MDYPVVFRAFQEAYGLQSTKEFGHLEARGLGELVVTSGKLLACDPYFCVDTAPFSRTVSPGRYPVVVSVAHMIYIDRYGYPVVDQRVVLAAIIFADTIPISWKNALPQDKEMKEGQRYHYCVDSGTGSFMDQAAVEKFAPICLDYDAKKDPLLIEMDKPGQYVSSWCWANVCLNQETGTNIIAFSSGWGDGGYPSYFGYDESGLPVCLLTEFGILQEKSDRH